MRKYQQKQILDLINSLRVAVAEIKRFFAMKDYSTVIGLLADCQEVAAEVGNYIESIEGEGTKTVSMLTEFCDTLYSISTEIESIGAGVIRHLDKHLVLLENNIQNEQRPNSIEIAFLSYKASMSDSIESIYLAAKADPACDAYWIPIPYYDRKPNGKIGSMQYEGSGYYADNIEITDWKTYNIKARHPDVIFTFNPYDSGNYVTSVHPDFYCEHLRNYTDLLVYVPYFVVDDHIQDHFCTPAGCVYAHRVILQSEEIRNTYMRVFKKQYSNKPDKLEEKFIAFGSPKFDKVINTGRTDYRLPYEWQKLIGNKKVVLYNTVVSTILKCNEQYLRKLRYVLDTFRNTDDAVLWWRPHPLSEATYESMRPQLLDEYKQLVSEYKQGEFGIYDDTPEMNRAIAWSDAYYGDESSLVVMYKATGKPVFMQDVRITEHSDTQNKRKINFYKFKVKDNILWGVLSEINGLFSVNLETNVLKYHGAVPGERMFDSCLYSSLCVSDDYVTLIPHAGSSIVTYESGCNSISATRIDNTYKYKFVDSYINNGVIYAIPFRYPALVKYNTITGEILEDKRLCSDFKIHGSGTEFFSAGGVNADGVLTFSSKCDNTVVRYDTHTGNFNFSNIGNRDNIYSCLAYDGASYWLFSRKGSIVKWIAKTGVVDEISHFPEQFNPGGEISFRCAVTFDDDIYVFPYHSNMILRICTRTDEVTSFVNLDERNRYSVFFRGYTKYNYAERAGDFIYASSRFENCLQKINPKTGSIENIPLVLSDEDYSGVLSTPLLNLQSDAIANPWHNYENSQLSLPFFIDRLTTEVFDKKKISFEQFSRNISNFDGTCGVKTYEYVRAETLELHPSIE